jgi:multiple sugar transport system permease protein
VAAGGHVAPGQDVARQSPFWRNASTIFMLLFLVYFFLPLIWILFAATKTNGGLFSSFGFWLAPDFNLLQNLHEVFTFEDGVFVDWMENTLLYATCGAIGSSVIAALCGYAFAKYRFAGRNVLFGVTLAAVLVPTTVTALPLYLLFSNTHLINTQFAVILPALVNPFSVYLMRIYTEQAVPDELIDAAHIDGAGELRIFVAIVFRLLTPGFVTILLFAFVGVWNNYFLPLLVLNDASLFPVTLGLSNWNALASTPGQSPIPLYPLVVTGALVSIVPLIVAFLFLQRFWRGGLVFGSIQ